MNTQKAQELLHFQSVTRLAKQAIEIYLSGVKNKAYINLEDLINSSFINSKLDVVYGLHFFKDLETISFLKLENNEIMIQIVHKYSDGAIYATSYRLNDNIQEQIKTLLK